MTDISKKIKGIGAEVRGDSFSYRATVSHLGRGGTKYEKFNGRWLPIFFDSMPAKTYRALRAKLQEAIKSTLGKA